MNEIELKSLAKINLGLDVLGRRENGYHDVRMVMQSIYLHDEVKIEEKGRNRDCIEFKIPSYR
jgi:4-diphosphocytidyl-2-C-methyl-D-erythritol kinase